MKLQERLRELAEQQRDKRGDALYFGLPDPELDDAAAQLDLYEAAMREARDKFREYEQIHRLKNTAEGTAKAKRNSEMADKIDAALNSTDTQETPK